MFGAIIGDIAGSTYEFTENKSPDVDLFPSLSDFTDDSILTVATCEVLLAGENAVHGVNEMAFRHAYRGYGARYSSPMGGYGMRFAGWLRAPDAEAMPYGSFGNGSAIRVTPVGLACRSVEEVLAVAERSAGVTHDHPEGIKGAQAAALAVFLAKNARCLRRLNSPCSESRRFAKRRSRLERRCITCRSRAREHQMTKSLSTPVSAQRLKP